MLDSIINFLSELFGNSSAEVPELDSGVEENIEVGTADVDEPEGDSSQQITESIGVASAASSTVVTGNSEVDTLLTKGIDTEPSNTANTNELPQQKTKYRDLSFGRALHCNVCSCKCYSGGDSSDSLCTCNHYKWQHYWG